MTGLRIPQIFTWRHWKLCRSWRSERESQSWAKPRLPARAAVWETDAVIIGLFPELDAPGGVQRAGRHMALVLSEFAVSKRLEYRLLSLNDSQELHRLRLGDKEFVFTGAARGKTRFAATAIRAARRGAQLT